MAEAKAGIYKITLNKDSVVIEEEGKAAVTFSRKELGERYYDIRYEMNRQKGDNLKIVVQDVLAKHSGKKEEEPEHKAPRPKPERKVFVGKPEPKFDIPTNNLSAEEMAKLDNAIAYSFESKKWEIAESINPDFKKTRTLSEEQQKEYFAQLNAIKDKVDPAYENLKKGQQYFRKETRNSVSNSTK